MRKRGVCAYDDNNVAVFIHIAQTPPYGLLLRVVQLAVGKIDTGLSFRQLRPHQPAGRVFRKENFPYERAGKEGISTLESIQDEVGAGAFRTGELVLADCDDRCDFGGDFGAGNDPDRSTLNLSHASIDIALALCLEPDMLQSASDVIVVTRPHRSDAMLGEDMKDNPHLGV